MIEQFLFAHPALFEASLWLDLPFWGAILGLVLGIAIRWTHTEFALEKLMTYTLIGTIIGFVLGNVATAIHYWNEPIYWSLITSENYLVRTAAVYLIEIVVIQLVMNIVVKHGKAKAAKRGYINLEGERVEEA